MFDSGVAVNAVLDAHQVGKGGRGGGMPQCCCMAAPLMVVPALAANHHDKAIDALFGVVEVVWIMAVCTPKVMVGIPSVGD